jgi:hypothetical protein
MIGRFKNAEYWRTRRLSRGPQTIFLLLATVLATSGCTAPFPVYSISAQNVETVRTFPFSIRTGSFAGDQKTVSCRLQPIGPESGETFAAYIKKALDSEMIIAGSNARSRPIEISSTVKEIDVDCGIISASWIIESIIRVNGGTPYTVRTVRPFDGNYIGGVVLGRAYTAFVPSIQQHINDILNSEPIKAAART